MSERTSKRRQPKTTPSPSQVRHMLDESEKSNPKKHKSNPKSNPKKGGLPSETTTLTPAQAKKKLREGKAKSEKQKGFFGAVAGKGN